MTSPDLTHAFGRPATASLRGLLPPRHGTDRWPQPPEPRRPPDDEPPEDAVDAGPPQDDFEDDLEDEALEVEGFEGFDGADPDEREDGPGEEHEGTPPPSASAGSARPTSPGARREERPAIPARQVDAGRPRPSTSRTDPPRGRARVANREHAELVVLLSLRPGPADGRGVIARLRESSGGDLDVGEQTVYLTLHRLARNRLLGRRLDPASGRRFYVLSEAGERAARARLREWHALTRGVDAVARAGG